MYEKMFEQAESFLKPMNEIWALNAEVLDTLKTKQTDLLNEVVADSVNFANGMAKSNLSFDSMFSAQQTFWGNLGEKIATNTQDNIELISGVPAKCGELFKESTEESLAALTVSENPKAPAKKKAATKKAVAKPAAKVEKPESTVSE